MVVGYTFLKGSCSVETEDSHAIEEHGEVIEHSLTAFES